MAGIRGIIAYMTIGGFSVSVELNMDDPEEAMNTVKNLFSEMEAKVESIRLADKGSGYFIKNYS